LKQSIRPCRGGVVASVVSGDAGFLAGIPDGLPVKPGDCLLAEYPKGKSNPFTDPYIAIYPANQKPKEAPVTARKEKNMLQDLIRAKTAPFHAPIPAKPEPFNAVRMTSLEIAELTGKRHDNVKRTIETLAEQGVIRLPQIEDFEIINNLGLPAKVKVYVFDEAHKLDSITVVAQLSPQFTAALVKRWDELEQKVAKTQIVLPQNLSEALRMEKAYRRKFKWPLLKKTSEILGYSIGKAEDRNYGEVNTYHADVWRRAYALEIPA
jgi:phage regulator Rha-like protein